MFVQVDKSKFVNMNLVAKVELEARTRDVSMSLLSADGVILANLSKERQAQFFDNAARAMREMGLIGTIGEPEAFNLDALMAP